MVSRLYRPRKFVNEWNGQLWDKEDEFLDVIILWSARRYFRKFPPRFPRDTCLDLSRDAGEEICSREPAGIQPGSPRG